MSKAKKIVVRILIALLAVLVAAGIVAGVLYGVQTSTYKKLQPTFDFKAETFEAKNGVDRIHFMNTASSDAILIESNGRFALVDAAEDSDFPADKPNLEYTGYEERVLEYLKAHAAGADGKVVLDFVVGTHAHSDHIGGFDTIINDDDVIVKKAYLKEYDSSKIKAYEIKEWDNQEVYDQMVNALKAKNVEIISDIPDEPFTFGDFEIKFFNTGYEEGTKKIGENDNSLAIRLTKAGKNVLLSGDMDNISGDEKRLADDIGKIDLLKSAHHGYALSSSYGHIKKINPDVVVVPNTVKKVYPNVMWNYTMVAKAPVYATVENNGIIAEITDSGEFVFTNNIH